VTTQRSERSTANHSLDHPEDATIREVLRAQLIGARKAVGVDMALLGLAVGRYDQWLYRTEVHSRSEFWKFNTVYDWGRAVGMNVFVHPRLTPVLKDHLIGPLARAGVSNPAFSAVGFLEYVQAWANFKGIEQRHIAKALDVNHGTMYAINESNNPRILTLQKYVRALGGRLEFHVEPIRDWRFVPVPPPF
jgi:DNA-binding phage protein